MVPKKRKGKKAKKDPNKPKRSMSSFMFFANDKRGEVRLAHPELKITEIGKELGTLWKQLPAEDKKKYEEQANKDKERYHKAMEKYTPPSDSSSSDEPSKKKRKKTKTKKDPNKPKRGMSSFMFFANDKRAEVRAKYPELKVTEAGKKLSELWKELPPEEKKKYEDQAMKDKDRYTDQMKGYKPPPVESESSDESSSESESS